MASESVADLFFSTHTLTSIGILFNAWPDGGPVINQPQKWIDITRIAKNEIELWTKQKQKTKGK